MAVVKWPGEGREVEGDEAKQAEDAKFAEVDAEGAPLADYRRHSTHNFSMRILTKHTYNESERAPMSKCALANALTASALDCANVFIAYKTPIVSMFVHLKAVSQLLSGEAVFVDENIFFATCTRIKKRFTVSNRSKLATYKKSCAKRVE